MPTLFRALRHRNYRLFFGGQMVSLIGTWMQRIGESWLVYQLSHSAWALGIVAFGGQIPIFILGPLVGVVADRVNRHRLIVMTQTASMVLALALAAITFTHVATVGWILLLAILLGVVNAFDMPARQAFVVEMVEREDLMNAIALNSSIFNGARLVGPAIAGLLVAWLGEGWCFLLNGLSYIAVIAGLVLMRLPAYRRQAITASLLTHFLEGYRYVRRATPISALLLLLGTISVAALPYIVLMPIFAARVLHSGARGYGLLMSAAGAGALVGALLLAAKQTVRGLSKVVAVCAFGVAIGLGLFSWSRSFSLSMALLFAVGLCLMAQTASSNTLLQTMTDDRFRGRVMSFYGMMIRGMAPIGSLVAGWLSSRWGAPLTVSIGAVVTLLAASAFAWKLPALGISGTAIPHTEALKASLGEP